MSRFRKLPHTLRHCQYHVVWVPKYRYRVTGGPMRETVDRSIRAVCGYRGCDVMGLDVQRDHVHLIVVLPPKVSVSVLMGRVKGQASTWVLRQFPDLRPNKCWANHFWAQGYCVDTVGVDAGTIGRYVT